MNRQILPIIALLGVVCVCVGLYLAFSGRGTKLQVSSSRMWVDTGFHLDAGQSFSVQAQGQWKFDDVHTCGADGMGRTWPGLIVPNAPLAGLVGKVGNQSFFVGSIYNGSSPASGNLFLSINDTPEAFIDNFGSLEVSIR